MTLFLFWSGIVLGGYTYWHSLHVAEQKKGFVLFPFFLLLAAAVAKYVGA